jgi:hypothetical protein
MSAGPTRFLYLAGDISRFLASAVVKKSPEFDRLRGCIQPKQYLNQGDKRKLR